MTNQSHHRVALISGGLLLGGSTTYLINFSGELARRGIPIQVISFERENPMSSDFERQNVPVLCLNQRRMIFEDRMRIVLERLSSFEPTVVISTLGAISFEVLRYLPSGIFRVGMGQSDQSQIYVVMARYAPWMDLVAMVSQTMKQKPAAMAEFAQVPEAYLPYGVPICPDSELPVRDFRGSLRILYLGRLEQEQKRAKLFPEILRGICESGVPFHWTIAGEGSQRGFLEANLKTDSPDQTISFLGQVHYADVPSILKQHDIFLLASDYEGLPLSLLEAMAYGLVPVVSDLESGISEVVDKTVGLLVPPSDVAGYARAIIRLHEHREELAAKSSAARARVQQEFSVAAMTDRWLASFPQTRTLVQPWAKHWHIRALVNAPNSLRFSLPMRVLRRVAASMRR